MSKKSSSDKKKKSKSKKSNKTVKSGKTTTASPVVTLQPNMTPVIRKPSAIMLDLIGTATKTGFLDKVLMEFVKKNIKVYLDNEWNNPQLQEDVAKLREASKKDAGPAIDETGSVGTVQESVARYVLACIDEQRGNDALFKFRFHMWFYGYDKNKLVTAVYTDVADSLAKWHADRIKVYVCSNSWKEVSKRLLAQTVHGNLTTFVDDFFDSSDGLLTQSETFSKIAERIQIKPSEIVFLTKSGDEARAALAAGWVAVLVLTHQREIDRLKEEDKKLLMIRTFTDLQFDENLPPPTASTPPSKSAPGGSGGGGGSGSTKSKVKSAGSRASQAASKQKSMTVKSTKKSVKEKSASQKSNKRGSSLASSKASRNTSAAKSASSKTKKSSKKSASSAAKSTPSNAASASKTGTGSSSAVSSGASGSASGSGATTSGSSGTSSANSFGSNAVASNPSGSAASGSGSNSASGSSASGSASSGASGSGSSNPSGSASGASSSGASGSASGSSSSK